MKKILPFVILLFLLTAVAACTDNKKEKSENESKGEEFNLDPDPDAEQVTTYDDEIIEEQTVKEKELLSEYEDGSHTIDDPFVRLDPYDAAPLSAYVMFETEDPAKITVTVQGEDEQQPMKKTFDVYEKEHQIPLLGLFPDTENIVQVTAEKEDGKTETSEFPIKTEPLPNDFLHTELEEAKPEKMEDGLTFLIPSKEYLYGVDDNADVRWYSSLPSSLVFKRLENGNVLQATEYEGQAQYNEIIETDMLGKVINAYTVDIPGYDGGNMVHHDIIELPNGNFLATTHEPDSDYIEDEMIEIDRDTGKTLRQINLKDVFPEDAPDEYDGKRAEKGDWAHQNAIWFDEEDNSILLSIRSQDLIMKLSYPEAEIQWVLAADEKWPEDFKDYLLDPGNEDIKFPAGQHAVKTLPDQDGNPDTLDIILFDNNNVIYRGDKDVSGDYSRIVQYRINEKEKSVEEVWSYGEERGKDLYSSIVGNSQYLYDTGNRLMTSGHIDTEGELADTTAKVVEVMDDKEAEVVYELTISDFTKNGSDTKHMYRSLRMPLYPERN